MITTKDRSNLDRHLKLAAQWLKKRHAGWESGMNTKQAYEIEQRLFPSLSLLSDYAQDYLLEQWPEKPWPLKAALIATLQSDSLDVFHAGLAKLAMLIEKGELDFYISALWLANPKNLTKDKLHALLDSKVPPLMGEKNFHQCYWSEDTLRTLAVQVGWSLPGWLAESNQLKHSIDTALLRALILREAGSAETLMELLASKPSDSDMWQWITLSSDPIATDLYFQHCEHFPNHLAAAALQGSNRYLEKLMQCFNKASLAEAAVFAVESILATPIEWQPVLTQVDNGKPVKDAPSLPIIPNNANVSESFLLQGQTKTVRSVAHWLLAQPTSMQALAWYHLGQCCNTVLPNLSQHWTHSQWRELRAIVSAEQKVSHAA